MAGIFFGRSKPIVEGGPVLPYGVERWNEIPFSSYEEIPLSTHDITVTNAASEIFTQYHGCPIRYTYFETPANPTYYYGIIRTSTATSLKIEGPDFNTSKVFDQIWIGQPEQIVVIDLFFPGLYAATAQTLINNLNKSVLEWGFGNAFLVHVKAWKNSGAAGGSINVQINSTNVLPVAISPSGAGAASASVNPDTYDITLDDDIEVIVTSVGATGLNLTTRFQFVLP